MGRNKITRWLDATNEKLCFAISSAYYRKIESGKPVYYMFTPRFYPKLLLRILIIAANLFRFRKDFYYPSFRNLHRHRKSSFLRKAAALAKDLVFSMWGLNYFIQERFTSEYYERNVDLNEISFRVEDRPLVSIIVPVFNQLHFTLNCLRSLYLNIGEISYEIIIVDDCSTDKSSTVLPKIKGLVYLKNNENLGFLQSCNWAAKQAKGELICLVNNDTLVQSLWLKALVQTIQNDVTVGAVGSKLIYPYGLLQEAGGIIFSDASGANYGKFEHLKEHKYNYLREVDYCSGASLLFRKTDFETLGGFDVGFSPAYYEDTDFCFSLRYILNKKIVYQPASEVVHFEGVSSGKVASASNVKYFQLVNQDKFIRKWRTELDKHHGILNLDSAAKRYLLKKQILVIDSYLPKYDTESGSNRLYHLLKILRELRYHIIFIPDDGAAVEPYYSLLTSQLGIETLTAFQGKRAFRKQVMKVAGEVDIAWICRPNLNNKYSPIFERYNSIKWIYDTVDLHYVRLARAVELFPTDKKIKEEYEFFKRLEIDIARKADVTVCITAVEQEKLSERGITSTVVIPNIHNMKTSVGKSFGERSGIIFIGGYNHYPNVDAALFLCNEIMPLVWRSNPDIKLTLLGSHPPAELLTLVNDNIAVTGFIPDVSSYFETAKLLVAPLRFGAGMKGKIGHSFEYALPVITTTIGAEGMNLKHGDNILIADRASEVASEILRVYNDELLWKRLSENSQAAIANYSDEVVSRQIKEVFESLDI